MTKVILNRLLICLALILTSSVCSFAQVGFTGEAELRTARTNWEPFFTKFKVAVRKRDQKALKSFMPAEFHCWYFEICSYRKDGNLIESDKNKKYTPDSVFISWSKNNNQGWNRLNDLVTRGVVYTFPADPAKSITLPKPNCKKDYSMLFTFRDGRWLFENFGVMGCGGH